MVSLARPTRSRRRFRLRKWLTHLGLLSDNGRPTVDEYGRKYRRGGYNPRARRGANAVSGVTPDNEEAWRRWRADPMSSRWWNTLHDPQAYTETSAVGKAFRKDFRVPKVLFDRLLQEVNQIPALKEKPPGRGNGRGMHTVPNIMKLAAILYMMGNGTNFRTVDLISCVSEGALLKFAHTWWENCADGPLFKRHVSLPKTQAELQRDMEVYRRLGCPGAMGSKDGVHLMWGRCPSLQTALHKNGKEKVPTLAFNVTVNHAKRIIDTTGSTPGTRNDIAREKFNRFAQALEEGSLQLEDGTRIAEETFRVRLPNCAAGEPSWEELKGPYLIADGGFAMRRIYQFPFKITSDASRLRWSKRVESVRKDVECTFGILKKRFRILALPLMFPDAKTVERIFKTCCMLHNRLLHYDGLDTIGTLEDDWLTQEKLTRAHGDSITIQKLVHRYAHVVAAIDTMVDDSSESERDQWRALRMKLITHYNVVVGSGDVQWCAPASLVRPQPHRQVTTNADGPDRVIPRSGPRSAAKAAAAAQAYKAYNAAADQAARRRMAEEDAEWEANPASGL